MVQTVQKTMEIPQLQCMDKVVDDHLVQVVHVPQVQIVWKIHEIPEIQTDLGTQTSKSLGTALVHQVAQREIEEAIEIGVPLLAESASPRFVKAPVLEAPPVRVCGARASGRVCKCRSSCRVRRSVPTAQTVQKPVEGT